MGVFLRRKRTLDAVREFRSRLLKSQENSAEADHPKWVKRRLAEFDSWLEQRERAMELRQQERRGPRVSKRTAIMD